MNIYNILFFIAIVCTGSLSFGQKISTKNMDVFVPNEVLLGLKENFKMQIDDWRLFSKIIVDNKFYFSEEQALYYHEDLDRVFIELTLKPDHRHNDINVIFGYRIPIDSIRKLNNTSIMFIRHTKDIYDEVFKYKIINNFSRKRYENIEREMNNFMNQITLLANDEIDNNSVGAYL